MEKLITYENLRRFAYSNDHPIKGEIKGIVLSFMGLGYASMRDADFADAKEYAEEGVIYVIPYTNPWSWMNRAAVALTDEIVEVLCEKYALGEDVRIVSTGLSMGGLSALTYCAYARITPVASVTNCPVCDLPYHFTERNDLPRTLYSAFFDYEGTMDQALRSASPVHLAAAGKMPRIPYTILHCEEDTAVNLETHSEAFATAMRPWCEVRLLRVPLRGHCELSPRAQMQLRISVLAAFA
jgi:dipeptidyl aminopeptidase/acylaminoacyl peptidase